MSRYYTKTLTLPATKQDGLANFIQMVINRLETATEERAIDSMRAQVGEAILIAVDLWNDVHCGNYREVTAAGSIITAVQKELQDKHVADLASAYEAGRVAMKAELATGILGKLGLA